MKNLIKKQLEELAVKNEELAALLKTIRENAGGSGDYEELVSAIIDMLNSSFLNYSTYYFLGDVLKEVFFAAGVRKRTRFVDELARDIQPQVGFYLASELAYWDELRESVMERFHVSLDQAEEILYRENFYLYRREVSFDTFYRFMKRKPIEINVGVVAGSHKTAEEGIPLTLMHYNRDSGEYVPQKIIKNKLDMEK